MEGVETVVGEEDTCASLLESLQVSPVLSCSLNKTELILASMQEIWDEVGETNEERDRVLLRLDRDCLDIYKREYDQAVKSRAHLLHTLVDAKEKLINLLSLLGEETCVGIPETTSGTIKEQLEAIAPALERLSKLRDDTIKEFYHVRVEEEDPPQSPEGKGVSNAPCERKKRYSLEETKLLARIHVNISEDPLIGSMPRSRVLWKKIAENYNAMKPEWALERDHSVLTKHWDRVQKDLSKFTDHVTNLQEARPSGTSWDDIRKEALRAFYKDTKKKFKYEGVWEIVQRDKLFGDASSDPKRKKLSTSGKYSTSGETFTDPIDLDSRRIGESLHVELAPCGSRPMSHRAAKRKTNGKASSGDAAEEKFLVLSEKMGSVGDAIMIKSYLKALEKDTSRMSETKRQQHEAAVKLLASKLGLV